MANQTYDVIVLGSGGAGLGVAFQCSDAGWKVAIVDRGPFGGTCAVRGCIPKKVLAGTAEIADASRRLHEKGIMKEYPDMDWGQAIDFKRSFTDPMPEATKHNLEQSGIDVFEGSPQFTGETSLEVNGQQLTAENIHVAVGMEPAPLPIEGADHLISSDEFLELEELPERLLFVGGGYISFEFAHVAARFGAEVTILHVDEHPLPIFDPDIVQTLLEASDEAGVSVELNSPAQTIEKTGDTYTVTTGDGRTFEADLLVHGAGRVPSVANLNLEAANIEYDKRAGIAVDKYLHSTSNSHVYAGGDVAAVGAPLTPVSGLHSEIVASNLLGNARTQPSYLSTASVVFSVPPAAKVGYLEEEARENGIEFDVVSNDLSGWFDSKRLGLKHARSKILIEQTTGKIVGAHIIGNHAEDLINIFSLAIELELTSEQLQAPAMAFPTASDDIRTML